MEVTDFACPECGSHAIAIGREADGTVYFECQNHDECGVEFSQYDAPVEDDTNDGRQA